jgi:hypothetical protein
VELYKLFFKTKEVLVLEPVRNHIQQPVVILGLHLLGLPLYLLLL